MPMSATIGAPRLMYSGFLSPSAKTAICNRSAGCLSRSDEPAQQIALCHRTLHPKG